MDDSHLAFDGQMDPNQPPDDHGIMALDFDSLLGSGQQFFHHEAIGYFNHDDSCLDPQGLIQCAHALSAQSTLNANAFPRLPQHNAAAMPPPRSNQFQTHSRDRHSISNPAQVLSVADQGPIYSWESLFSESMLDTSQLFPPSHGLNDDNRDAEQQPACDDDCLSNMCCSSVCAATCPSQCGETSPGVCCDDDHCGDQDLCHDEACQDSYQPCTDANCTALSVPDHPSLDPAVSDGDKRAAAALASFGGDNQLPFVLDNFLQFHSNSHLKSSSAAQVTSYRGISYTGLSDDNSLSLDGAFGNTNTHASTDQYWYMNPDTSLASHILQFHDPRRNEAHVRPCIADNKAFFVPKCALPKAMSGDALTCGFQAHNVDQFAYHLFSDHRQLNYGLLQQNKNASNDVSLLSPELATQAYRLDTTSAERHHFSPSTSSMPNLSVGSSAPPSPTSLATTPLLQSDRFSTEPISIIKAQSPATRPSTQPHIKTEEEEFVCRWRIGQGTAICGMKFKDADELHTHGKVDHLKKMLRDDVGFHCAWDDCIRTASFNQKSKLERHFQTHTGYKPVKCNICGLQLSAKQSLDQHMRTHTGEKPWKCTFEGCSLAFKQQSALTMHERTHTGYKPLVCDICNKSFGESSNLSKHRRTHNTTGLHVCTICNRDFHRLDQLRRHMNTTHKCKPEEVDMILKQVRGTTGRISRQRGASALASREST